MRMDLGKSGVRVMGTWSSSTAYEKNDIVTNGGDGYISITDVPVGTALSNTEYWLKIVNGFSVDEVTEAVDAWLVAHPEATTTVQDGAVTTAKIADGAVTDAKLAQTGGVLEEVADLKSAFSDAEAALMTDGIIDLIRSLKWENGNINASGEDANNTRKDFVRTIGYYKPKAAVKVTLQKNSLTNGIVYLIYSAPDTLETRTVLSGSSETIALNPQKYYRFCVTAKNTSAVIDLKNVSEYASFNMDMLQFVGGVNSLAQTQTLLGHNGVTVVNGSGSTTSGTKIEITDFPIHIKKEHGYTFYMAFSATFSKLIIGQGYQQVRGKWLEIDDTYVFVKQWTDAGEEYQAGRVEHGLSISKQLYVSFNLQNDGKANVTITSIAGSYSREFNFGLEATGNYFFIPYQNIGGYMMTAVSGDLRKPLWIFGDSYFSMYDNRIGGQIKNFGYSNGIMINAYPGRTSASAVTELQKCLNFGTPKYLVWCMGMNDGTEAAYETAYDTVAALCKEKNIRLILYRLPSVEAKLTVNEAINTFVISTGLRYVNAYRAVTNGTAGVWYDDMQASDGIHPTELGAKMLASRLLVDVPEILEY